MPSATFDHVGAGRLAHVRDLVDERDPRHQERVRGELDHLGRVHVAAHDRRCRSTRTAPRQRRASASSNGADDDPVGLHEVAHRVAFGEELRVRHVADVLETALVEPGAHLLARPDRHRRLHHERPAGRRAPAARRSPSRRATGRRRPSSVGGVSTQTKRNSQSATSRDVERERQPARRSVPSARARPARGTAPAARAATRSSRRRRRGSPRRGRAPRSRRP